MEEVAWPSVADNLKDALDALLASLRSKEATKRTAFTIPFMLTSDLVIGVNGYEISAPIDYFRRLLINCYCHRYNLIAEEKKRLPVKVDLNTSAGEEVITKTEYTDGVSMNSCLFNSARAKIDHPIAGHWTASRSQERYQKVLSSRCPRS